MIILIDDESSPPLNVDYEDKKLKIIRFDKEIGISKARNYGIKISQGDYIAFIDDDAVADANWLKEIQRGIRTGAEVLGGPLKPLFKASPPEWWNEKDFGAYAGVGNLGRIWGCNMIISKKVFEKIGLFRTEISRYKGKLFSGEDEDLVERAINKGYSVLFLPRAIVYHKVPPQRMTLRYILRWEYFYGKSVRKKNGYRPLKTFYLLFINLLNMANPCVIFSKRNDRIRKIAWLAQLLGQLV
jgi:GT2 family glycosyltransferase